MHVSATYLHKSSGNVNSTSLLPGTQVENELTFRPGPDVSSDPYTRRLTAVTYTVVIFHTLSAIIIISYTCRLARTRAVYNSYSRQRLVTGAAPYITSTKL